MVDETKVNAELNATSADSKDTAPTVKKTRRPRRTKAEIQAAAVAEAAERGKPETKAREKRGSKAVPVKAQRAGGRKSAVSTPAAATVVSIDDIAELVELEKENRSLRSRLSDKLRAENADLRKRLGQS